MENSCLLLLLLLPLLLLLHVNVTTEIEREWHDGKALFRVKGSLSSNPVSTTRRCVTQEGSLHLSEPHLQNGITDNYLAVCKV